MDSLHSQCAHTVSCFFNMRTFLIHLLRFVLRSEHDNLQSIGVVKYFIFEAGSAGCLSSSNKKVKLLLYYLFLGKQFAKGILTDKIKKRKILLSSWTVIALAHYFVLFCCKTSSFFSFIHNKTCFSP